MEGREDILLMYEWICPSLGSMSFPTLHRIIFTRKTKPPTLNQGNITRKQKHVSETRIKQYRDIAMGFIPRKQIKWLQSPEYTVETITELWRVLSNNSEN